MKNLNSILVRQFLFAASTSCLVIAFLALPALADMRANLANSVGIGAQGLWLIGAVTVVVAQGLFLLGAIRSIASPLRELAIAAEHGHSGFAFKTRSRSKEEDILKHWIESTNLKASEDQKQARDCVAALEKRERSLESIKSERDDLKQKLEESEEICSSLRFEKETLKSSKMALELTLDNERKTKIGIEVQKRSDEIYLQMDRAISAAAFKAIWLPQFIHELNVTIREIQSISGELSGNWSSNSINRIQSDIGRILKLSNQQLDTLDGILQTQVQEIAASMEAEEESQGQQNESLAIAATGETINESESILLPEEAAVIDAEILEEETLKSEDQGSSKKLGLNRTAPSDSEPVASVSKDQPEPIGDLRSVLEATTRRFAQLAPHAHVSYELSQDSDAPDPSVVTLLEALMETATDTMIDGEIILGSDIHADHIAFDVTCDGKLRDELSQHLDRAQSIASGMGLLVEIDRQSKTDIAFTFEYAFNVAE